MQKSLFAALLAALLALPFAAQAQETYLKLQVGQSDYYDNGLHVRPTGALLAAGVALSPEVDFEGGYVNFGTARDSVTTPLSTTTARLNTQSLYLAGIGKLPLAANFSAFGKLGLAVNYTTLDFNDTVAGSSSSSKTKATALIGAGFAYQFNKELEGLVEYAYYGRVSNDDFKLSQTTLGLRYNY